MPNTPDTLLCRYHYDPLDRLAGREVAGQASGRSFYQKNRLTTEIQGQAQRWWLQTPQQLLAQRRCTADISETALIGTDTQGSVLHGLDASQPQAYAYGVYGNRHPALDPLHLPGFNREQAESATGHYLLGNGYRAFNPVLMRFNSPDSMSPFGRGGLNAYVYCAGDPVNQTDPSGHWPAWLKSVKSKLGFGKKTTTLISDNLLKQELLDKAAGLRVDKVLASENSTKTLQELAFEAMSKKQLSISAHNQPLPPYLTKKINAMSDFDWQVHDTYRDINTMSTQGRVKLAFHTDYFRSDRFFHMSEPVREVLRTHNRLMSSLDNASAGAARARIRKVYPELRSYFE